MATFPLVFRTDKGAVRVATRNRTAAAHARGNRGQSQTEHVLTVKIGDAAPEDWGQLQANETNEQLIARLCRHFGLTRGSS